MLGLAEMFEELTVSLIEVPQGVVDDLPVHEILGMQDGQTRHALERRSRHIIILPTGTHTDIRVAIISVDHRVGIGAVAIIRAPH